jgi:hypothetical protein
VSPWGRIEALGGGLTEDSDCETGCGVERGRKKWDRVYACYSSWNVGREVEGGYSLRLPRGRRREGEEVVLRYYVALPRNRHKTRLD